MAFQKKTVRSTKAQIRYLCEYMAEHADFAAGDFKTPQGAAVMERQWLRLKEALDDIGPARSVDQWKVCWRDQKRKARVEGGALNKAMTATGNAATVPELSENSQIILDTIGVEMAIGCGPPESPIGFSASAVAPLAPPPVAPLAPPPVAPLAPPPVAPPAPVAPLAPAPVAPLAPAPVAPLAPAQVAPRAPASVAPLAPAPVAPQAPAQVAPQSRPTRQPAILAPPAPRGSAPPPRGRVRKAHPPDRFLKAQEDNNNILKGILRELQTSNRLRQEEINIKYLKRRRSSRKKN